MSMAIKVSRATARGDPGFLDFLKGVGKAAVGAATGFVTGGPVGAAIGGGLALVGELRGGSPAPRQAPTMRAPSFRIPTIRAPTIQRPGPGSFRVAPTPGVGFPQPVTRAGFGLPQVKFNPPGFGPPGAGIQIGTVGAPTAGAQVACPPGFRANKSSYFLRDGTFVAAGSKCVRSRRRNPLNPRALDRAISRVSSAKRASSKLGAISIRKKC